jgi:uncharacterized protein (TIGR03086 family)
VTGEPIPSGAADADADLNLLALARLEFKRRLALVGVDDWARPTPCTEWNVRQLVNHVIGSDLRYTDLLNGGSADDFVRRHHEETGEAHMMSGDPHDDWERSGAAFDSAIRERGAAQRVVDYPWGPLLGRELLENRIVDITIHTWDLARAIDADDVLDERLVRRCLSARFFQRPERDDTRGRDAERSSRGTVRPQDRLLLASGRSPT